MVAGSRPVTWLEGTTDHLGVGEGQSVPVKPGNTGGGKDPCF